MMTVEEAGAAAMEGSAAAERKKLLSFACPERVRGLSPEARSKNMKVTAKKRWEVQIRTGENVLDELARLIP